MPLNECADGTEGVGSASRSSSMSSNVSCTGAGGSNRSPDDALRGGSPPRGLLVDGGGTIGTPIDPPVDGRLEKEDPEREWDADKDTTSLALPSAQSEANGWPH